MLPTTDDIQVFILLLAWTCLSTTNPALKSRGFAYYFPTEDAMRTVMQLASFEFASGLLRVLRSAAPPTIEFFKSLPPAAGRLWAVYVLVLEKHGCIPRIYFGSATDSTTGVHNRMTTYNRRVRTGKPDSTISLYVEKSLTEGYVITHQGMVAWIPLPSAAFRDSLRAFILVLETLFALLFWGMKSRTKDYFMPRLCPWSIDSLPYHGLCTHFSINEGLVVNTALETLTPEEINAADLERKKAKNRQYIANKGEGVHAARTKAYGDQALEKQTFKCTVCDLTFRSNAKLLTHQARPIHINKAAGITKQPKGRGGSQNAITKRKHYCEPCDHAAASAKRLETHLNGPRHAKRLKTLASSSQN
jgi:hypothetical protein